MTEQFHLSRLQVINWGVFDGYHSIPFSSGGALIAGASGSGKSSLLDAISLGFLPFNRRNFNASGDNTAAGSSAGRRTVDKYVRGAWGQRSDGGSSRVMYLRGDGTAWSAVAVTYASDSGRTVTGLVLKWLTGESRNDSSSRFILGDGDLDIEDVCNRWAAGRFDAKVFTEHWRFSTKVESQYLAQLYATIGIRASDAAQQLLGKAKSLKSVGGLEQFVREFMLDEPDSLARLPEALKQIDPLVEARELLAVAQKKRKILGDIEAIQHRYTSESSDLGIIDLVDAPMVRAFTDHVRLAQCPEQIATLDSTIDQLENEYEDVTRSLNLAKAEADSLNAQISGSSANIAPLQSQVTAAETEAEQVERRRAAYDDLLTAQDIEHPDTADEFWNLREELLTQATELLAKVERNREASTDAEYAQKSARIARDDAAKELKRVEHVGSALPEFAIAMRDHICAAIKADSTELPYIAELLDLKPDQTRWRTAVEKVLQRRRAAAAGARPALGEGAAVRQRHRHARPPAAAPCAREVPGRRTRRPRAEHVGGQAVRRRPRASVRGRGRRRHHRSRRPHLRRHPRRVRPLPPRGHRHRAVQGLRPARGQGRPAEPSSSPSTCTRATSPPRSTR